MVNVLNYKHSSYSYEMKVVQLMLLAKFDFKMPWFCFILLFHSRMTFAAFEVKNLSSALIIFTPIVYICLKIFNSLDETYSLSDLLQINLPCLTFLSK